MKLLSIDLDGTLFNSDSMPTDANINAVVNVIKKGHQVIINSGRPLESILKYQKLVDLHVPIICHNGSQIYNEKLDLLYENTIPLEKVKKAINLSTKLGFTSVVETKQGNFSGEEIYSMPQKLDVFKIVFQTEGEKERLNEIKQQLEPYIFSFAMQVHHKKMEATSFMNSKGLALEIYQELTKKRFNDVYVIGDGENDIAHFGAASISVAMENATDEVKRKADFVTKSNDANGVAYAIKNIFRLI